MAYKFWQKKWDRESCTFELQEYGAAGKPGWATISKPTGEIPKKTDCAELFKPGCHYRIMAKSVETGRLVGTVWKHYELLPGGIEKKEVVKKQTTQPKQQDNRTPSEWMGEYAQQVAATLEPLAELVKAVKGLELFGGGGGDGGGGGGGGQPSANPSWPELEFSGKAPWVLHPWIVREVGNQIKDVGDHIIDKLSSLPAEMAKKVEKSAAGEEPEEEELEEEMPILPSADEYITEETETVPSLEEEEKLTETPGEE